MPKINPFVDARGPDGRTHTWVAVALAADSTELPLPEHPHRADADYWNVYDGCDGRPYAVVLRSGCTCGWRSRDMFPAARVDPFVHADPREAWNLHLGLLAGAELPPDTAALLHQLGGHLTALAATRPLAALAAAEDLGMLADSRAYYAAAVARTNRISWEEIGAVTGLTKQGAAKRFANAVPPKRPAAPTIPTDGDDTVVAVTTAGHHIVALLDDTDGWRVEAWLPADGERGPLRVLCEPVEEDAGRRRYDDWVISYRHRAATVRPPAAEDQDGRA